MRLWFVVCIALEKLGRFFFSVTVNHNHYHKRYKSIIINLLDVKLQLKYLVRQTKKIDQFHFKRPIFFAIFIN
jgi:hypothetical protein